ncbi:MAG TPA: A24 family peptidase C-terminal domain-containing protein [Thermoplasmata archaeon]|nr:A24 family peptidase C-terminal domain-containing protein [Thermoplasmata archaeon]
MDLDLPRVVVGLVVFLAAAIMDVRTRRVRDPVWVAFGVVALAFVEVDLVASGARWFLHLVTGATAILFLGVFFGEPLWDDADEFQFRLGRVLAYLLPPLAVGLAWWLSRDDPMTLGTFWRLLTMPGMIVVAHGLFYFGMLRGGADAKALMSLGLLFPGMYPHLDSFPLLRPSPLAEPVMAVVFPFAFVVLVNAALLFLVIPLLFLARNAAAGDASLPRALVGLRVPINAIPKHVWFMDRVEDGKAVTVYFPRRKEDRKEQIELLREHGFTKVWVTPQLPFIAAMFVGYVLAVTAGNLLLGVLGGVR